MKRLKIFAVTDAHADLANLSRSLRRAEELGVDVIAYSGDIESVEGVKLLASCPIPALMVAGNMDWPEIVAEARRAGISVEGELREIEGYYFLGVSGLFHANSALKAYQLAKEVKAPIILISHHPPYGSKVDVAFNGAHIGSKYVRRMVEDLNVILNLSGHVHEARGVDRIGRALVINPGPLSMGYCALVEVPSLRYELLRI